jgi:hypothetical protein
MANTNKQLMLENRIHPYESEVIFGHTTYNNDTPHKKVLAVAMISSSGNSLQTVIKETFELNQNDPWTTTGIHNSFPVNPEDKRSGLEYSSIHQTLLNIREFVNNHGKYTASGELPLYLVTDCFDLEVAQSFLKEIDFSTLLFSLNIDPFTSRPNLAEKLGFDVNSYSGKGDVLGYAKMLRHIYKNLTE